MDESKRQTKYARELKKDLATIFQKDPTFYFKSTLGTITDVSVSPDLSLARVHMSIFPVKDAKDILAHIESIKKEIRHKLGQKIKNNVRIIPELAFFHDNTEEKASKIDQIIDNLEIPPEKE